jgi:hypothetical protein
VHAGRALAGAVPLLLGAVLAASGGAHVRAGNFWSERQAESIRLVRGTPVRRTRCEGRGIRRAVGSQPLYRHFACRGSTGPRYVAPIDTVLVTYTLHPLGRYVGRRSGYATTNVRFIGHGVP